MTTFHSPIQVSQANYSFYGKKKKHIDHGNISLVASTDLNLLLLEVAFPKKSSLYLASYTVEGAFETSAQNSHVNFLFFQGDLYDFQTWYRNNHHASRLFHEHLGNINTGRISGTYLNLPDYTHFLQSATNNLRQANSKNPHSLRDALTIKDQKWAKRKPIDSIPGLEELIKKKEFLAGFLTKGKYVKLTKPPKPKFKKRK